jgi:hypothetical protein
LWTPPDQDDWFHPDRILPDDEDLLDVGLPDHLQALDAVFAAFAGTRG